MSFPALILLSGEWDLYLNEIYAQYMEDIVVNRKHLRGKPVQARYNPSTDGKGFCFWHVISEGSEETERVPDLRRCERIRWIGWMIEKANSADPQIRSLPSTRTLKRGTVERLVLWCPEASYVVILEERTEYFLLVTAYQAQGHRAKKLQAEWEITQK